MASTSDFTVGEKVIFGRGNGEQTNGTVVKVNRVKLKVRQDESRGTMMSHRVGTVWTVPPSLCRKVNGTAVASKPLPQRSEAAILADADSILCALSPENLHCDGERSAASARRVASHLRRQFRALEAELGRPITEFGSIDGAMPATLGRRSAKAAGWKVGDKVAFDGRGGSTVVGHVKRVNTKTISVQPLGGGSRYWRVTPGVLRVA